MASNLNRFEPLHKGHAIEQVLFGLQFEQEVDEAALTAIRGVMGEDKSLPGRNELRGVSFAFGMGVAPQFAPQVQAPLAGLVLSRTRSDGVVEAELRLDRNSILFRTILYDRWARNWAEARSYIDRVVPIYAKQTRVTAIGLNYVDKFVWQGNKDECVSAQLLQPNSPYLCPHVHKAKDLWHSHTGLFIRVDEQTKRLLTVNVDCVDEVTPQSQQPQRVVSIKTVQNDLLNQPGYQPLELSESNAMDFVDAHMHELHARDKEIISAIINLEMSQRIGLGV